MDNKIRVGILIDSYIKPWWAFKMLELIHNSNYAEIVLIIKDQSEFPKHNILRKLLNNRDRILFRIFMKLENLLFKPKPNAFALMDIRRLLHDVQVLKVQPIKRKYSDFIVNSDIENIKKHNLDVLVRLGFRILRGEILKCTNFGIWSYHHGDYQTNRGGPAGVWEVLEEWPLTGSTLQILTEELDSGVILYRSFSTTDNISVNRNRNQCYLKTLYFLPRKLEELYMHGADSFFDKVKHDNKHPFFYSRKLNTSLTNYEFIKLIIKKYTKYIVRKSWSVLNYEQWILMFAINKQPGLSNSFWKFNKMIPPKECFWADPHIIYKDNKYYVFIEEFMYKTKKGHISYLVIDNNGKYTSPQKILEKSYHLSHPYVFFHENDLYMIPDTSINKTVELYRCVKFPDKWEFVNNIMENVYAVDTTLFKKDGKWWLFTNIKESEGYSNWDELFLFYSSELLSKSWKAHPTNPIVSDASSARPAGNIFLFNDNIYRPSQNCSKGYGYGIKINQIIKLNEYDYQELCINSIEPKWDKKITGLHTLNFYNNLTIIDAKMKRWKPLW